MRSWLLLAVLAALGGLGYLYAQRGHGGQGGGMFTLDGEFVPTPADADEETEFVFARLAYRSDPSARWGQGAWMIDAPKAERHFLQGVRRLTSIHARSMEQFLRSTDAELFHHPWLYVVEPGQWSLSDEEAATLREYLLRGGTMITDDFHGTIEWAYFQRGLRKIFPDRPVVEIDGNDAVFHTLYDIDERFQVPGVQMLYSGKPYEQDGVDPHWRGIYDDKGRLMVIINFNMDLGDAWEHADLPEYPERFTAVAYRFGINYIVYAMTH